MLGTVLQFIEHKNLPVDFKLGVLLKRHFEFQYRKTLENQASSVVDLPRFFMHDVAACLEMIKKKFSRSLFCQRLLIVFAGIKGL